MRFIVDECCDIGIVHRLRTAGHDVVSVAESHRGASDAEVLRLADEEVRVFVTEDKDFGEHAFRRGSASRGVILVRIDPRHRATKLDRLARLIEQFGDRVVGYYTVVEPDRFRFRRLPEPR